MISGNEKHGLYIHGAGADENEVFYNIIGATPDVEYVVPNHNHGIAIYDGAAGNLLGDIIDHSGNMVVGSGWSGIVIQGSNNNIIFDNSVGTNKSNSKDMGNVFYGIHIVNSAGNEIVENRIAYNGYASSDKPGIEIAGALFVHNSIRRNSIHKNAAKGIYLNGGNEMVAAPALGFADCNGVSGFSAEPNAIIEIISDDENEGRIHEGTTTSSSGIPSTFFWVGQVHGPNVTATMTDVDDNTSEFTSPPITEACLHINLPFVMR